MSGSKRASRQSTSHSYRLEMFYLGEICNACGVCAGVWRPAVTTITLVLVHIVTWPGPGPGHS